MRIRRCVGLAATLLSLGVWTAAAGAEDEKHQCISASDQGQQLRDDGKYQLAREAFARCARETCPVPVRQDCVHWLLEVDQSSATIVVNAKDEKGNDLADVTVSVDGTALTTKLDGKPLTVDPGEHTLRFEASGFVSVDEHVVIHTAEKNRTVNVRLTSLPPALQRTETGQGEGQLGQNGVGEAPTRAPGRTPRTLGWVFAGVAVAAFATETYFGVAGLNQRSEYLSHGGCAPHCSLSEKNSVQTKFVVADVALGMGLVSSGVAAYFFFRRGAPKWAPLATSVDLLPRPGGAEVTLVGHF
jgi:hypothetical protein